MAGIVHVPWYATVFRGDKLEAALREIAPIALRYGATAYQVQRNRDDAYKFLHMSWFDTHEQWEAYWYGPEMNRFRAANQSLYQVPILYSWNDLVVEGYVAAERHHEDVRVEPEAASDAQFSG
jgi:hypothetical protein